MKAYRKITIIWIVFCVGFWFEFSQPHWFLCEEIHCLHRVTNVRLHCFIFDQKWAISSVGWSFPLFQSVVFFFFFSLFFFWVFFFIHSLHAVFHSVFPYSSRYGAVYCKNQEDNLYLRSMQSLASKNWIDHFQYVRIAMKLFLKIKCSALLDFNEIDDDTLSLSHVYSTSDKIMSGT